jgi:hypothetical protein
VKVYLLSFFLVMSHTVFCQRPAIETEHWANKPVVTILPTKYGQDPAVTVQEKMRIEFIDDKDKNLVEYFTLHKIIHLNNDHGIENYNKIYINVNKFSDVVEIRARAILPNGKVMNIDTSSIKDLKDEDGSLYKIFAFEGLENGCDIEYVYTIQKIVSLVGKLRVQEKFPVMESVSEIISPTRLVFDIKSIHCKSDLITDTLYGEKTRLSMSYNDISGLEEEKYSDYEVNRARLEYKLSYNNATHPGERMFTWNEYAKKIFLAYGVYSEKEIKKITQLISDNRWALLGTDSLKIISVENYIKKNITYRKDLDGNDADGIETILKTQEAEGTGLMRLYGSIYKTLGVDYQFVLAGDREEDEVDRTFENWNNCSNQLIYFPGLHHFLVPTIIYYRYPYFFPSWGNGNAIFCKNVSVGTMNTAIAQIKYIPLDSYQTSFSSLDTRISVNAGLDSLVMDMKFDYAGYMAPDYRYGFYSLTPDKERDAIKEFCKNFIGTETILSYSIENRPFEDENACKPFILNIKAKSGDLIERAGNKMLLKIGMAIGPQTEMYQEKKRQLPISMPYPHFEQRTITFTIPEGYQIRNPDDLRLKQVYQENGEQTMGFVSDYTLSGNLLTINIMEDYRKSSYPVSQYEDFRKIINTSSDFNKVVLILEKK